MEYFAIADFPRRWCDDRLWSVDCQSKELSSWCGGTVWYFAAYILALLWGFNGGEAAAVSIIGGADGPTSIFLPVNCSRDI